MFDSNCSDLLAFICASRSRSRGARPISKVPIASWPIELIGRSFPFPLNVVLLLNFVTECVSILAFVLSFFLLGPLSSG